MKWTTSEVRRKFLEYFASKQHEIVDSAPMVVKDDPTLMFVNAGMNQFKDLFLGINEPINVRVANTQKCLRVSGKHNDLEEVGVDHYHHTLFEMLGNWSFGDYFKKEAIDMAWELLTEVYGIEKDRLYITCFKGDESFGLGKDDEAAELWKKHVDTDRILEFGSKDNFWEMGNTGPCGPCSEIHVDLRNDKERKQKPGHELVNCDHEGVIEIWNLVFIQYERKQDGTLINLPKKHVDTGMGLERLTRVLQKVNSNYETDILRSLIAETENLSGVKYCASSSLPDTAFRVVSDHVRTIAFSIADGQIPSNSGAGYVIRRILRRAFRYGYSYLGFQEPFMFKLIDNLAAKMGSHYVELNSSLTLIKNICQQEESSFLHTLEKGIQRLDEFFHSLKNEQDEIQIIPGKLIFELYDTYGFPYDLTSLMAKEKGMQLDERGYKKALNEQKSRSRSAAETESEDWVQLKNNTKTDFVGYDTTECEAHLLSYRKILGGKSSKMFYQIVLNKTPFYPEGGGQVGDQGILLQNGSEIRIFNTVKENDQILHFVSDLPQEVGANLLAKVDLSKRKNTCKNHSATHLLHLALRNTLGEHVEQKGSLVESNYFRFDFSHFQKLNHDELTRIQQEVDDMIKEGIGLSELRNHPIQAAKKLGAMALFGEKYGENVRVICFGTSVELCGGTHVNNTAEIGLFHILSESSIAAGVRRIEAITGDAAEHYFKERSNTLSAVEIELKQPKDILGSVQNLLTENQELQKKIEFLNKEKAGILAESLQNEIEEVNSIKFIGKILDEDASMLKDIALKLRASNSNLFVILGGKMNDKANIAISISDDLVKAKDLHAGVLVKELSREILGGGGGQPYFATAGGKKPQGLVEVIVKARSYLA